MRKTSGHRSTFANHGDMRPSVEAVSPALTVTFIAVMPEVRAFATISSSSGGFSG
jgi:hypothetical protein